MNPKPYTLNPIPSIIFWGTPEFALPSLEALVKFSASSRVRPSLGGSDPAISLMAVVTNPDEPAGRKNILTPPPVKVLAEKYGIPVIQPESLKIENWKLQIPDADLYVVAAYGKIIPKDILEIPKFGALNVHPSLLPRWRGPSPIQYTILNGDQEAGVTIIKMDEGMDHGPIVARQQLEIPNSKHQIPNKSKIPISKMTYPELHDALAKLGAELLTKILPEYLAGKVVPIPQDDSKATYSKILKKEDGRIDWKRSAEEIERMVRAFTPWPGAWTIWPSSEKIYRLRIESAGVSNEEIVNGGPGYVKKVPGEEIAVKTGKGVLALKELTLEGRKKMEAAAFLRGHPELLGSMLV